MASIEKRKELKELVFGNKRSGVRRSKIFIKIKKEVALDVKPLKQLPLLCLGLYSLSEDHEIQALWDLLRLKINYAINKLQKPADQMLKSNRLQLQSKNVDMSENKGKLLLLDLDQTLIYSNNDLEEPEVQLIHKKVILKLNIRPHCRRFLKKMADFFDIYIFTSGTIDYAEPIVKYLNGGRKLIKGILHRSHCLKTKNGLYIKDLRIIKNYELKDIVIVDNKLHSFSFQLDNGVPIQDYNSNEKDEVLIRLGQFLMELASNENVIQFLKDKLKLRKIIEEQAPLVGEIRNEKKTLLMGKIEY